MQVQDYMSSPAITVTAETPFQDALKLMQASKIRRLPVVDSANRLVGIVSERDLLHASPSPATSLSVWELNYLLWRLTVRDIMTEKVVAVAPTTPLVEAARLMVEKKIGGLPVVDEQDRIVGVITETDIFKRFVAMATNQVSSS
ncbi:MAG: CBS domain-containing protein [Caldilineaceae bacterium]|nr:CBS domain-containing protein [Caldilineaceae bacterium]